MEMIFCPNCQKLCGFKRALGVGTLFMAILTLGLWLLIIPFYPVRCINCGLSRNTAFWENLRTNPRRAITTSSIIAAIVALLIFFLWTQAPPKEQQSQASNGTATQTQPNDPPITHRTQAIILGFRPGETPRDVGTHAAGLGLSHVGDCKYRSDAFGIHTEYVDCQFTGDAGEILEASFYKGGLQRISYDFPVEHYSYVFDEISKGHGQSRTLTDPNDPSFVISQEWGGFKEGYSISLGKTADGKRGWAQAVFEPSQAAVDDTAQ